jgi:hypothetical protein
MVMSISDQAHTDAVRAVDKWISVSKQSTSLGASARAFAEDVRSGANASRWAKVNVEQILPFRSETPRLLLVVRAGGLFLPILLTWLALSQVIGPFALYLQNQQASANFLWFWQTNPGNSFAGVWELGHVALVDAAVLAFLTVLAMRITWWETSRAERTENAYAEMLSALEFYFVAAREN